MSCQKMEIQCCHTLPILCIMNYEGPFVLLIMKDLRSLTAIGQILSQMDWRFLCIFYCRCRCHFNFKATTPILTLTPTERRFGSAVLFDLIATWYQAIPGSFFMFLLATCKILIPCPAGRSILQYLWKRGLVLNVQTSVQTSRRGYSISKGKCLLVATQRNVSRCIQNSRQAQAVWCLLWFTLSVILAYFGIEFERKLTVCQTWSAHSRIQSWSQVAPTGRYTSSLGTQFSWQELAMKNNTANTVAVTKHHKTNLDMANHRKHATGAN